jgi:hypothetical protein
MENNIESLSLAQLVKKVIAAKRYISRYSKTSKPKQLKKLKEYREFLENVNK